MKLFTKIFTVLFMLSSFFASTCYAKKDTKTIGVTLLTLQHPFYQDLKAGLEKNAKKCGFKLLIVSAEFDPAKQANQIDDFIVKKVDALIISPCDSRGISSSIVEANKANIPVFTADIANQSTEGKVISHIASDNFMGGIQAAELMNKALHGKGDIIIITHPGVTSVIDRVNGFKQKLKSYPSIKIVAEIPAWGQRAKAASAMEDMLVRVKNLKGVFGINDDSALGALSAIEAAGKVGKIMIIGYDAVDEAKEAIKKGAIFGDVIQYPTKIGELTIDTIFKYFNKEKVKPVIPVEVGAWTKENSK